MGAQAFVYPLPSQKQMLLSGILGGQAGLRQEAVLLSFLPIDGTDVVLLAVQFDSGCPSSDPSPFATPSPPGHLKDRPFLPCVHGCPFRSSLQPCPSELYTGSAHYILTKFN